MRMIESTMKTYFAGIICAGGYFILKLPRRLLCVVHDVHV